MHKKLTSETQNESYNFRVIAGERLVGALKERKALSEYAEGSAIEGQVEA